MISISHHIVYMDISTFSEQKGRSHMIDVSGHLRDTRKAIGFQETELPLVINCCGSQKFLTRDYAQARTVGRIDYQIIYIFKGAGHYFIQGEWQTLTAGHIVLFRPGEPQVYAYYAAEHPEIFWIHFTGTECEALLKIYDIKNCYIGDNQAFQPLFQEIILELQLKKPLFQDIINHDFYKLLALMNRTCRLRFQPQINQISIDRLVTRLHHDYQKPWNIPAMAEFCGLSPSYFSVSFKRQMGTSPNVFLNTLRVEKAKELLFTQNISIAEIAPLVGFEDPFYFSRVFKRITGMSPRQFQQNALAIHSPYGPDELPQKKH